MTVRHTGWWLFVTGLVAVLGAYLLLIVGTAGIGASLVMIYGVGATLAAPLLLANAKRRLTFSLAISVLTVLVVIVGGFAFVLLADPGPVEAVTLFGLPVRATIVLLGIGLVPAAVLPWAYSHAARHEPLDRDSLAAFVAECRAAMRDAAE